MDNDRYTIILEYEPDNPEIRRNIIECLSRLNPAATRRIEMKIAGSSRLVVKRDTDLAAARRLKHLLRNTGAVCHVKKQSLLPEQFPESIASSLPSTVPDQKTRTRFVPCPNCGFRQPPEAECRSDG